MLVKDDVARLVLLIITIITITLIVFKLQTKYGLL
jgi:hypothetical protein